MPLSTGWAMRLALAPAAVYLLLATYLLFRVRPLLIVVPWRTGPRKSTGQSPENSSAGQATGPRKEARQTSRR